MEQIDKFNTISNADLEKVDGGVIPLVVLGFWSTALGVGFAAGVATGNAYNSRKRR